VEAAAQHLAGKLAHQDRQPFDLGLAIREFDEDYICLADQLTRSLAKRTIADPDVLNHFRGRDQV
jgi:hypothetical protein